MYLQIEELERELQAAQAEARQAVAEAKRQAQESLSRCVYSSRDMFL
jgi:F0F1-type ATP synthase membrane subunit b/b'